MVTFIDILSNAIIYLAVGRKHNISYDKECLYARNPDFSPHITKRNELPPCPSNYVRIVIVSDTHSNHHNIGKLPKSDIFIHCGDILMTGRSFSKKAAIAKLEHFNEWLSTVSSNFKVVIAGNHDNIMEDLTSSGTRKILKSGTYLENDELIAGNYKIWGSPLSQGTSPNKAFQSLEFSEATHSVCPQQVDILITHGYCPSLVSKIDHKIHIWGHAHNSYGIRFEGGDMPHQNQSFNSLSICAPLMDGNFNLNQLPIVIDVPKNPNDIVRPAYEEKESLSLSQWSTSKKISTKSFKFNLFGFRTHRVAPAIESIMK